MKNIDLNIQKYIPKENSNKVINTHTLYNYSIHSLKCKLFIGYYIKFD